MKMEDRSKQIELTLKRLGRSRFRSRFHLGEKERSWIETKGEDVLRRHGRELIEQRLSAAYPKNDGKQTPMHGHPVFIAQHATACCCRQCLEKWHRIPMGRALQEEEIQFILALILAWIEQERLS